MLLHYCNIFERLTISLLLGNNDRNAQVYLINNDTYVAISWYHDAFSVMHLYSWMTLYHSISNSYICNFLYALK